AHIVHLPLTPDCCRRLPAAVQGLYQQLHAAGQVTVGVELTRQGGSWQRQHVVLQPEGASVCYELFPYPIHDVTGTLDLDKQEGLLRLDVTGSAHGRPVKLRGFWKGSDASAEVKLDLEGKDLLIEDQLLASLPEAVRDLARSY